MLIVTPVCCANALQIKSIARRGDSVPEHIVATRIGRPASSSPNALSEQPSNAAPFTFACSSAALTRS